MIHKWVRLSRPKRDLQSQTTYRPQTWQRRLAAAVVPVCEKHVLLCGHQYSQGPSLPTVLLAAFCTIKGKPVFFFFFRSHNSQPNPFRTAKIQAGSFFAVLTLTLFRVNMVIMLRSIDQNRIWCAKHRGKDGFWVQHGFQLLQKCIPYQFQVVFPKKWFAVLNGLKGKSLLCRGPGGGSGQVKSRGKSKPQSRGMFAHR